MISLSLYTGHNAAICIMKEGEILLNWELERFSRIKHDYGYNHEFLEKSLALCDLEFSDIDHIITNRQSYGRSAPWHYSIPDTSKNYIVEFKIKGKPAFAINHHLAHVASTFLSSPFGNSVIITQDGGGDDENFSFALGQNNKILNFSTARVKNISAWWSGITLNNYRMPRLHEWDPGSGAGKIMALASYGQTSPELEKILENSMQMGKQSYYTDPESAAFNNDEDLSDVGSMRSKNVAAALQSITETELRLLYQEIYNWDTEKSENLCLAGGLALNCVANTRVKSPYKNIHVPPFPNDTGLAAGMGLLHWHHILENPRDHRRYFSPYLGPRYDNTTVKKAIKRSGFHYYPFDMEYLTDYLAKRKVICMYHGRSESGPRALGHRSIMVVPDSIFGRDHLNFNIKMREWYRPYAPIILDKYVDDILDDYLPVSPYMSTSGIIKTKWRKKLSAVNHVDNSTRPQIIKREHEPFIYNLIEQVHKKTGIPALLNTSFNNQEPIVETPEQALATFKEFDIDLMVMDNYIVEKKPASNSAFKRRLKVKEQEFLVPT